MSKGRITVTIDQALLDRARSLGVNLSAACERGILDSTALDKLGTPEWRRALLEAGYDLVVTAPYRLIGVLGCRRQSSGSAMTAAFASGT